MANPNIVGVTHIYAETESAAITTGGVQMAHNAASSGKVYKLNVVSVSNVDGINDADVTVALRSAVSTTPVPKYIVKTVTVPADSTLIVIDKNTSMYLKEDMDIFLTASATGDLEAIVSYEAIDDAA
jgi:hypothetical protein